MSLLQWLHGKQQQQHKERKVQKQIYQQKDSHKERQGGRFNTKRKKKNDIPKKININSKIKRNSPVEINLVNMISIQRGLMNYRFNQNPNGGDTMVLVRG